MSQPAAVRDRFMDAAWAAPPTGAIAITPGTTFSEQLRGIWVGGGGALAVTYADGSTATLSGIVAGTLVPGMFTAVAATASGTSATLLIGML